MMRATVAGIAAAPDAEWGVDHGTTEETIDTEDGSAQDIEGSIACTSAKGVLSDDLKLISEFAI